MTTILGWTLQQEALDLDRQRLARRAAETQTLLDTRLEQSEMLLQHLRDYLTLSGENREPIFDRWCYENGLTINCPWILGIAVATNRHAVDFLELVPNPPATWTEGEWNSVCRLMLRTQVECRMALHSSVTNGQRFLSDYNLQCAYSDRNTNNVSSSRSSLADAVLGSRLGMSRRQPIMWDADGKEIIGTVFYVPVYRPGLTDYLATTAPRLHHYRCIRWLHLSAIIVAPVDFKRLVKTLETEVSDLGIEVFSSTNQTAETWLNSDRVTPRAKDSGFRAYLTQGQTWPMYGEKFSLFFYTTPLFEAQSPRRLAKTAVLAGLAVTLLATALVGVSVRARNRQDHLTRQIREARDALAAAQREREKISRDLHDGTIQSLYAIQLGLARTAGRLRSESVDAGPELSGMRQELDAVIAEIRQFITVEAEADKAVDLCTVLQAIAQRLRAGTTARIAVQCDPRASARVTGNQAVQLANIAREGLSNALRHGRPQRVDVHLRLEGSSVFLEIADNGIGFSPSAAKQTGLGLISMSTRATEAGGTFDVNSSPGQGTRLVVRLPVPPVEVTDTTSPDLPDTTP